ncbi:Minor extracellular protease vpr [Cytospora mali]|uniref:Minor extracellular protease vpr n=1 Tax=Cytospora mali TaxID=578113 RepID=A0A194VZU2_CYTMA|nr:Minor extracellular protease vpr [Valsa mali]
MHLLIYLSICLGSALATVATNPTTKIPRNNNTIPGAYIVEFAENHDHSSFYSSLKANGIDVSERMNLSFTLFNGVSFNIKDFANEGKHASKISASPAVKQIWPVRTYSIPQVQRLNTARNPNGPIEVISNDETKRGKDAYSPHVMTQVDRLHTAGYTGKGARIGIVDTGVDYKHPALGGCFGKGCLVSYGWDLVGDNWTGFDPPKPDADPYDNCNGHGTHVAGIIGAQPNKLNFTGAAPGATLGMYRVIGCLSGGTTDDILIAAFNMAYEDGSDIITASIGGLGGWSEAPWSSVVSRIVDNGVPCTLAAGNEGAMGLFMPSDAADGKGVTAVASFDNVVTPSLLSKGTYYVKGSTSEASSDKDTTKSIPFGWLPGSPYFENITLPLWATSHNSSVEDDACSRLPANTPDLSNHIVLVRLGGSCDSNKKAENVAAFGAQYILFYADTEDDLDPPILAFDIKLDNINGSGVVLPEQGTKWVELLNNGSEVHLTFVNPYFAPTVYAETGNTLTGGFLSTYTTWGPTWELEVYPTLGAPGGNILSTYPLDQGGYAILSGTSMATPFMAAVYALVGQARGTFDPTQLGTVLTSNARAQLWNDGTGTLKEIAPVPQQGTGLVQAYNAAFTTTLLTVNSLSFNDSYHSVQNATFTIRNMGHETVTYNLGNSPGLSMYTLPFVMDEYYPEYFPNRILADSAVLEFSESSVKLPPKGRAEITVTPTLPALGDVAEAIPVYSGFITINGTNGENLTIPYLGVIGSVSGAFVMDPITSTMLGYAAKGYSAGMPDNMTFSIPHPTLNNTYDQDDPYTAGYYNYPSAVVTLDLGTRIVRADVIPLSANYTGTITTVLGEKIAGSVYGFPQTYLTRFYTKVVFTGLLDDGTAVPEGQYALAVRALRLFGDPEKSEDYDTMAMLPFSLNYLHNTHHSGIAQKGAR